MVMGDGSPAQMSLMSGEMEDGRVSRTVCDACNVCDGHSGVDVNAPSDAGSARYSAIMTALASCFWRR